ncbi:hypothetical protein IF1G_11374 [Cordyceps javanica]|uniref:Uncharacterized protein n=1 Tax=Cordyceps javanica TaxID=43265 RepID=A0A545UKH0_9HYPO|nr:hypothetical protein IF1G_11374 [Cordyceps javanica]
MNPASLSKYCKDGGLLLSNLARVALHAGTFVSDGGRKPHNTEVSIRGHCHDDVAP